MAIEGPLRELGIHDVFQLLDLSRKTGTLTVTSPLRDNLGRVYFDHGAVVFASMRSNAHPLGELLVRAGRIAPSDLQKALATQQEHGKAAGNIGDILVGMGALSRRELERHVRFQIEEIVFDLLSWQEGYFSFEERSVEDVPVETRVRISTESLLMEGARRIDEWSRMERVVPNGDMVPSLAGGDQAHAVLLDLLPHEWEVLAEIDGRRDLRGIARRLAQSEFEIARILYGLVTTGIVELSSPDRFSAAAVPTATSALEAAMRPGATAEDVERAVAAARHAASAEPRSVPAQLVLARALRRAGRHKEAGAALRSALEVDASHAEAHRELGFTSARQGALAEALAGWEQYLRLAPAAPDAARVRAAIDAAVRLNTLLEEAHV